MTAYLDVVYIRNATALGVVLFSDVFSPFDEAMREERPDVSQHMDAAVARLRELMPSALDNG